MQVRCAKYSRWIAITDVVESAHGRLSHPLGSRTNMCPRCRRNLTENIRAHVYGCPLLPVAVRQRAQAVREAARHLVEQSHELVDKADVLIREAEAALLEAQQELRVAMKNRPTP